MAYYGITGVWIDNNDVISHYAVHEIKNGQIHRAKRMTKSEAVDLLNTRGNTAVTVIWDYKKAIYTIQESITIVENKFLRSNPDNKLTDNLSHLVNYNSLPL